MEEGLVYVSKYIGFFETYVYSFLFFSYFIYTFHGLDYLDCNLVMILADFFLPGRQMQMERFNFIES